MPAQFCPSEASTRQLAAELATRLVPGDVVLLEGPLGAGKTTFVKGVLEALGYVGFVRSPTFNLLQEFEVDPPILHVDLYRVPSANGLGIEEYLDSHCCLIEWPDRLLGMIDPKECWQVRIAFEGDGRSIEIVEPSKS